MTAQDQPLDPAALLSQMDQMTAVIGGVGEAFGKMRQALVERDVPPDVADVIVTDAVHQWAQGNWNKPPGLTLPGFGPPRG